jgi:hypothetical protein
MAEWPRHLRLARNILSDELGLDEGEAQVALITSYHAAHICAQAINQRSRDIAAFAERVKLRKIFGRLGKCAQRSPAYLRRALDHGVRSAISETIEALIHALVAALPDFQRRSLL